MLPIFFLRLPMKYLMRLLWMIQERCSHPIKLFNNVEAVEHMTDNKVNVITECTCFICGKHVFISSIHEVMEITLKNLLLAATNVARGDT